MSELRRKPDLDPTPHPGDAIVVGFGVPGRAVAEVLERQGARYRVIELNRATVLRCKAVPIVEGDASKIAVLIQSGVETASLLVIAIPDDRAVVAITRLARQLNPTLRIVARCHFISAGMEARQEGADEVIIAEQVVATELARAVDRTNAPV